MDATMGASPPAAAPGGLGGALGGAMGKDDFLQLLVAQLRNQDPMSPANPEDFAAQLAQFSTLESMLNMQDALETQSELQQATLNEVASSTAVNLIGREVVAAGDALNYTGDPDQEVSVVVGGGGGSAVLRILDAGGKPLEEIPLGPLEPGRHDLSLGPAAAGLESGPYRFEVEVVDAEGEAVEVQTFSRLTIDGVRYGPGGPVLTSAGLEIPLADVIEVSAKFTESDENEVDVP
jgi:flagellar basal-body rod modification protein FlgD